MKTKIFILAAVLIFVFAGYGKAEIVALDLSTLGMPANFNGASPYWQSNFDLGITFSQISNVYINWSGSITGGWGVTYEGQQPYPMDVGVYASFGFNNNLLRRNEIWGGSVTYPLPLFFDQQDEFITGPTAWTDLLDGAGRITLGYTEYLFPDGGGGYIQHGSIALNSATLIVDGIITPEPCTLVFFSFALPLIRAFPKRRI